MRYSADHKAAARARIVSAASRAIREQGLEAPSVPHIMREAGLTHGGFYNHFQDRDALIAEAIAASASETLANVLDVPGATVDSMLALYLSGAHVANPGEGCVLAALGTDAPHATSPLVRGAFAATARGFISHIGGLLRSGAGQPAATGKRALSSRRATKRASTTADVDDDALVVASRMIGAVILARLVDDEKLATRILAAARRT